MKIHQPSRRHLLAALAVGVPSGNAIAAELLADLSPATYPNSSPLAGARWYFYATATTSPQPVYTTAALTTLHGNPVVADASGRFPEIYFDRSLQYRGVLQTAAGALLRDIDPIDPALLAQPGAGDGSGEAVFHQAGDTAVPRTLQDKSRETISVKDFGAKGNGSADDTAAIQAAIDHASTLSDEDTVQIMLPAGTYTVTPATLASSYIGSPIFGQTLKYALRMKSNVRLIGSGATLKVADNVSSRSRPQNFAVFYSEEALSNVKFEGVTFDMNARNNYFSPDPSNTRLTQEQRYKRYHQAAIFWEGNAGRADDVTISECTFKNQGGVSVIICGRVGSAGVGRRWRILDCNFLELGLDTYDHSSIFLWCDDALVEGCFWRNALIYAPTPANLGGVNSAIETHGSNTILRGNLVDGANRGFFVTENGYSRVEAVKVTGNILRRIKYCGVDIAFDGSGGKGPPRLVEIADNLIDMSADDTNVANLTMPTGIQYFGTDSTVAPIESLIVARNEMKRAPSRSGRASQAIGISLQAANFGMIDVMGNGASGFTRGAYIITDRTTTCEAVTFSRNRWRNPDGGTVPAVTKVGWLMLAQGGRIGRLTIDDEISDTRNTNSWAFGIVATESAPTTVREFHVARSMVFDDRFAIAARCSGITDLTLSRLTGVPVTGVFPDTSYASLTGAVLAARPLPGVKPTDELVVGYESEVTNAGGFLLMPFYSGTDEVSLALRNVTNATLFTTPGFTFRITAYPGR